MISFFGWILFVCFHIYLSICLSYLSIYLSIYRLALHAFSYEGINILWLCVTSGIYSYYYTTTTTTSIFLLLLLLLFLLLLSLLFHLLFTTSVEVKHHWILFFGWILSVFFHIYLSVLIYYTICPRYTCWLQITLRYTSHRADTVTEAMTIYDTPVEMVVQSSANLHRW